MQPNDEVRFVVCNPANVPRSAIGIEVEQINVKNVRLRVVPVGRKGNLTSTRILVLADIVHQPFPLSYAIFSVFLSLNAHRSSNQEQRVRDSAIESAGDRTTAQRGLTWYFPECIIGPRMRETK